MASFEQLVGPSTFHVVATATNGVATATQSAPGAGKRNFITSISFSVSAAPAAAVELTITEGATTIETVEVPASVIGPQFMNYVRPLRGGENSAVAISMPALGAGVKGAVCIHGFVGSS